MYAHMVQVHDKLGKVLEPFQYVIISVLGPSLGVCSHGPGSKQAWKTVRTIPGCNYVCFRTVPGRMLKNKSKNVLGPFLGVIMISVLGPSLGVCSHGPGSKQAWKGQVSTHRPNIFPKSQRNGKHYFS